MLRFPPCLLGMLLFLVACGGGGKDAFADLSWRVRCPASRVVNCPSDGAPHSITNFNGEDGNFVRCTVNKLEGEQRLLSFQLNNDGEQLSGENILFTPGGPVTMCEIRVTDDGNTYEAQGAACGANAPNDTQVCQLAGLNIDTMADPRDALLGSIVCRDIAARANPSQLIRDLTDADTDGPVNFVLQGCDGNGL